MTPVTLRIRELRERKGWSQAELARRAGVHNSVVNRAERGLTDITMATLEKLATALGVSPRRLLAGK
jgi:transcriptional regulator with XRE-family HTH domain